MDPRKIVLRETSIVAAGVFLCSAAMVGVFAALGYFTMAVLWGAVTGFAVTVVYYFFIAVTVNVAANRAEAGEAKAGQTMIQLSSILRLLVVGVVLLVAIKLGANVIALVLPLAFMRPVLMVSELFRKKGD